MGDPRKVWGAWSVPKTRAAVLEALEGIDWSDARAVDVGAGSGLFTQFFAEYLDRAHGLPPEGRLFACDTVPESFVFDGVPCDRVPPTGRLPYDDDSLDAVVSVEVIEHVEDQFAFVRELARVVKPGGRVVVTTPNVLNINSRVRNLLWGFPLLYDPLPPEGGDRRGLAGHIHPISPYFLAFAAQQAGLSQVDVRSDRTKRSAVFMTALLYPFLAVGSSMNAARLRRKNPRTMAEDADVIRSVNSWRILTGRTAVLRAVKPAAVGAAR